MAIPKSIEEKQQERNKELAERKEADSNYKPADLDDRTVSVCGGCLAFTALSFSMIWSDRTID